MIPLPDSKISFEYDEELQSYYTVWDPMTAIGLGRTEKEALEELRAAAHYGVDTAVNIKLAEISREEAEHDGPD
jgi:hypothetical protein